jgi:hypothetical protein
LAILQKKEIASFKKYTLHLSFLKRVLRVRKSTSNYMVYFELGRFPLYINSINNSLAGHLVEMTALLKKKQHTVHVYVVNFCGSVWSF